MRLGSSVTDRDLYRIDLNTHAKCPHIRVCVSSSRHVTELAIGKSVLRDDRPEEDRVSPIVVVGRYETERNTEKLRCLMLFKKNNCKSGDREAPSVRENALIIDQLCALSPVLEGNDG